MIKPSGIPTFSGDLTTLDEDAILIMMLGDNLASTGVTVHNHWQGLAEFYDAPEAPALFAATGPLRDRARNLGADVSAVGRALSHFAAEVRPIADRLGGLRAEAQSFVDDVASDGDWDSDSDKVEEHNRLLTAVDAQMAALMAAERTAANAINALFGGTQYHVGDLGTEDPNAHGFDPADVPEDAERPWGTTQERDKPWYQDLGDGAVSFGKGLIWDGIIQGDLRGLTNMLGFWGPNGSVWSLDTLAETWKGLAKLAGASATLPLLVYNQFNEVPGYKEGEMLDVLKDAGKGLLAWDEWKEDPARAAGQVTWNVLPLPTKLAKVGDLSDAGKIDGLVDVSKTTGLAKAADAMAKMRAGMPTADDLVNKLKSHLPDGGGKPPSMADIQYTVDNPEVPTGRSTPTPAVPAEVPTQRHGPNDTTSPPLQAHVQPDGTARPVPTERTVDSFVERPAFPHVNTEDITYRLESTNPSPPSTPRIGGTERVDVPPPGNGSPTHSVPPDSSAIPQAHEGEHREFAADRREGDRRQGEDYRQDHRWDGDDRRHGDRRADPIRHRPGDGIVYLRIDRNGGKPYVGRSHNLEGSYDRYLDHTRNNPDASFDDEIIVLWSGPPDQLGRVEEYFIRKYGGPTNKGNPDGLLANRRHEMSDKRYSEGGGDPDIGPLPDTSDLRGGE
jgi:hypothetical protein